MLVFYLYVKYSGMYVSESVCVFVYMVYQR